MKCERVKSNLAQTNKYLNSVKRAYFNLIITMKLRMERGKEGDEEEKIIEHHIYYHKDWLTFSIFKERMFFYTNNCFQSILSIPIEKKK